MWHATSDWENLQQQRVTPTLANCRQMKGNGMCVICNMSRLRLMRYLSLILDYPKINFSQNTYAGIGMEHGICTMDVVAMVNDISHAISPIELERCVSRMRENLNCSDDKKRQRKKIVASTNTCKTLMNDSGKNLKCFNKKRKLKAASSKDVGGSTMVSGKGITSGKASSKITSHYVSSHPFPQPRNQSHTAPHHVFDSSASIRSTSSSTSSSNLNVSQLGGVRETEMHNKKIRSVSAKHTKRLNGYRSIKHGSKGKSPLHPICG